MLSHQLRSKLIAEAKEKAEKLTDELKKRIDANIASCEASLAKAEAASKVSNVQELKIGMADVKQEEKEIHGKIFEIVQRLAAERDDLIKQRDGNLPCFFRPQIPGELGKGVDVPVRDKQVVKLIEEQILKLNDEEKFIVRHINERFEELSDERNILANRVLELEQQIGIPGTSMQSVDLAARGAMESFVQCIRDRAAKDGKY